MLQNKSIIYILPMVYIDLDTIAQRSQARPACYRSHPITQFINNIIIYNNTN